MKLSAGLLTLPLAASLAAAAPPFVLQAGNPSSEPPHRLADLTVDDHLSIQEQLEDAVSDSAQKGQRLVSETFDILEQAISGGADEDSLHPPFPPPFLDFSNYTVLEIVNASFAHHKDGEKGFERKNRRGAFSRSTDGEHEHKPHPSHLPLHRLAGLINFSPEAAKALAGEDITLLAPDDWALTPSHKRHDDHFGRAFAKFEAEEQDDASPLSQSLPHPFHARELSPRHLGKLAMQSSLDGGDDEEKKKEFFKKVIAIIGKYHVLPKAVDPRHLADHSTVPSSLHESRVRVSPAFSHFPFPHPTLKFNGYSTKRGPFIKAKNGVIYLISAPLFPPLTPLNQLFLAPQFFSAFTSDVQKVGLAGHGSNFAPEFSPNPEHEDLDVNPLFTSLVSELTGEHNISEFTVFTPTNAVLKDAPPEIVAFLHSPLPIAKAALKYILGGHIVPGISFYSDFFHNGTEHEKVQQYVSHREQNVEVPLEFLIDPLEGPPHEPPHHPPHVPEHPPHHKVNVTHYVLPTLLTHFSPNATIKAAVFEFRLFGFGPKRRSIVIFPSHGPPKEHERGEKVRFGKFGGEGEHEHKGPRPIRVAFPDVPAHAGAIHVLGDQILLPPPPPHHEHDGEGKELTAAARRESEQLHKVLSKLYAA
ncbi:hypothetical protein JCM8547_005085 [Rhodosporidiobolus lusitaniae]